MGGGGRDPAVSVAKWLSLFGALCVAAGALVLVLRNVPGLEKLPLDVVYERRGFAFYLPLGTCIIASVVLTGILWLVRRMRS